MSVDGHGREGGYLLELENRAELEIGNTASQILRAIGDSLPAWNVQADPLGVHVVEDQLQIGACVGNSGTSCLEACYFLSTGKKIQLSRAAGYYLSQRVDGIRGDRGATLSGFRKVATSHGLPLEADWPYPSRYNPSQPQGIAYPFKAQSSTPIKSIDEFDSWIKRGLPVHAGFSWNSSCEKPVVDRYRAGGGGGHAVMFWQMAGENYRMLNSWGQWQKGGWNEWSPLAIESLLKDRWTVFIGYAPDGMSFPKPEQLA